MDREILARLTKRARARWPAFGGVTNEELEVFIAVRVPPERIDDLVLVEDLLLACACAKGVRAAHDALSESASPDIDRAYARIRPPIGREAARHLVLDRLLIAPDGGAARIGQYTGERDLIAFVRAVATRTLLSIASGQKGPESLEDAILRIAPGDAELELVKKTYLPEFRSAFSLAAGALDPRERALLRYAIIEQLGADAIGRMYGVNRVTVTRWIEAAREKLELYVRKHIGVRLRVSDRALAGAMRCVTSQLDLSLTRTFAERSA